MESWKIWIYNGTCPHTRFSESTAKYVCKLTRKLCNQEDCQIKLNDKTPKVSTKNWTRPEGGK